MTFAKGFKRFSWWEKFKKEKFEDVKKILGHVSLYVGLIMYTAWGGWMFQFFEHPYEKEFAQTLQTLVLAERINLKNMIYNLTSNLSEEDLDLLYECANMDQRYANSSDDYAARKCYMLSTNRLDYEAPARPKLMTKSKTVNEVIEKLDNALLSYEMTLSNATSGGIDVSSKEIDYKWTYVSSVFFTSTVITTVGYGNIAPVTVGGRTFCIFFASIGIPYTLTVLADLGVIFATIVTTVGAKGKTIMTPIARWQMQRIRSFKKRRRRRAKQRKSKANTASVIQEENGEVMEQADEGGGEEGSVNAEEVDESSSEDSGEEDEDKIDGGIAANIMMGLLAIASLCLFMSCASFVFTRCEADWEFFDAFYYCFITMTTIGFGDMVPDISEGKASYMMFCMTFTIFGLAFFSTIIELVRRQYQESWTKMQELRAQIQAQLKLAEHLRKMAEEGKDVEGMEVDMAALRGNMKRYGMDLKDLDWLDAERRRKVKAVTIFFYETSL